MDGLLAAQGSFAMLGSPPPITASLVLGPSLLGHAVAPVLLFGAKEL